MKKAIWVLALVALALAVYYSRGNNRTRGEVNLIDEGSGPLRLRSLDGHNYYLEDYQGKVVVVEIWDTRQKECVAFLERVKELDQIYQKRDVVILTANVDGTSCLSGQPMSPVGLLEYVRERGLKVPVLLMDVQSSVDFFSGNRPEDWVPHVRVYDRNLRVRYKCTGESPTALQDVESVINRLLEQ